MTPRGLGRRTVPYLASATGGFVLAYAIVAVFVFPGSAVSSSVSVPNVTGIAYTDAAAKLQALGLKAAKGEQRYETGAPAGTVLAQNPVPGTVAPKGTTIILDLSRGERMGNVPRLLGLTRDQAVATIQSAGFELGDVQEVRNDAPRGQVLSTTPAGGTRAPVPSRISLVVSSGPATVAIPDVTGQSFDAARSLLLQLGFAVGKVTTDTNSVLAPNSVLSQSPAANTLAPAGTTINLTIAVRP